MKYSTALLISLIFCSHMAAQGVFSNETNVVLEEVVKDYANDFRNIKGALLNQKGNVSQFNSTLYFSGALSTSITETRLQGRDLLSWNTTVYKGHDFNEAKQKFREMFDQLKNSIIKLDHEKPFILSGVYEEPSQGRSSNIVLELLPATKDSKRPKVKLSLEEVSGVWTVNLSVSDGAMKP